jgi:hypothetical protein
VKKTENKESYKKRRSYDSFLVFLCFLASGLLGYFLTHLVALLGA